MSTMKKRPSIRESDNKKVPGDVLDYAPIDSIIRLGEMAAVQTQKSLRSKV